MQKKLFFIFIILCVILSLAACGQSAIPPEDQSGIIGDVEVPGPSGTSTAGPDMSTEDSASGTNETQSTSTDMESVTTNTHSNTGTTVSKTPDTPTSNTPPASTPPPSTSTPTSSAPANPTYTEADYNAIIAEVKAYAEGIKAVKFMWKDTFVINGDDCGYYGHPDLTSLSRASVIGDLKFHVGLIENAAVRENSPTVDFYVTWKEIEGAIHFFVLYG
jgi:hypothetical protein